MFDRSRTRFHDKNWQKSGARFFFAQFGKFLIEYGDHEWEIYNIKLLKP
jgi:hypothetical protein